MIDWLCGSRRGIQLVRRVVLVVTLRFFGRSREASAPRLLRWWSMRRLLLQLALRLATVFAARHSIASAPIAIRRIYATALANFLWHRMMSTGHGVPPS